MMTDHRVNDLLENGFHSASSTQRGKLRVFFGFAAGVGKTYTMLLESHELMELGKNVVIGYIEPHNRPDTNRLINGLPEIPVKKYEYKNMSQYEPDIDEIIKQKPDIVLIDELAHSNIIGSRNKKRYQDIEELLNVGINVFTTVNVQHIESLNDIVEKITQIQVKETVPDTFFQQASLKVIDVEPSELIDRLEQGKIYANENAIRALQHFFTPDKLDQLRGLAIQRASDHINRSAINTKSVKSKLLTIIDDTLPKMGEKCIRWTARLAQGVGADWSVIQIRTLEETPTNVPLAEKLGAEVLSIEKEDSFETIIEYAKMIGATDIIMGKNLATPWYEKLFVEDFEDRLIRRLSDSDIHLIPFKDQKKRAKLHLDSANLGSGKDALITLFFVVFATILTEYMQYFHIGNQNMMMIYIFFVLLTARYTAGYLWSALASVVSVLAYNWFFVEPLYSLEISKSSYPFTLVIMLIVALMVSNLMVRLKKQAEVAKEKEHQLEILYELNKQYMTASSEQSLFDSTTTYLSRLLNREITLYDSLGALQSICLPNKEERSTLDHAEERAVAFWVVKNQKEAGKGSETLSGAKAFYLPIIANGKSLGALGIERNTEKELGNNQLNYLKLILTQIATVLEQFYLTREKEKIEIENESEKVRSNLLRAVSHDLRTPLTAISGIAETLSENLVQVPIPTQQKLLKDIQSESQWLIRMVENLLSVTRINMDTHQRVNRSAEPIEEIISSMLSHIRKVYPKQQVITQLPAELIFIQVDPILIEQVLFNLVENGIRHGLKGTPIYIKVMRKQTQVVIQIENDGDIPLAQYQTIQSNLTSEEEVPVDSKNGLGIGLSIVKTIIRAHDGELMIQSEAGKTLFQVYLNV